MRHKKTAITSWAGPSETLFRKMHPASTRVSRQHYSFSVTERWYNFSFSKLCSIQPLLKFNVFAPCVPLRSNEFNTIIKTIFDFEVLEVHEATNRNTERIRVTPHQSRFILALNIRSLRCFSRSSNQIYKDAHKFLRPQQTSSTSFLSSSIQKSCTLRERH